MVFGAVGSTRTTKPSSYPTASEPSAADRLRLFTGLGVEGVVGDDAFARANCETLAIRREGQRLDGVLADNLRHHLVHGESLRRLCSVNRGRHVGWLPCAAAASREHEHRESSSPPV